MPAADVRTGLRIRRARQLPALLASLEPHEPRATSAMVDLLADGLGRFRCRAWTVERDGELVGAVVLHHRTFDRWYAKCLLVDPEAAPLLARVLDRSPAWSVSGSGTDIGPLTEHLHRGRAVSTMTWVVAEFPVTAANRSETDERVRDAGPDDLDALLALYRDFELSSETTMWQLRGTLSGMLARRRVLVFEEDGVLAGALVFGGPTSRYFVADGLTVLPEHRSRGIAWTLAARAQRIANQHHLGATAAITETNAMSFAAADLGPGSWVAVALGAPRRFRGQGRLRRLYARFGSRTPREREVLRRPEPKTSDGGPVGPPS